MVSLFCTIAFHIVLIVCIGERELDATQKMADIRHREKG
jgi:formate hydrogenlyase subunit 4